VLGAGQTDDQGNFAVNAARTTTSKYASVDVLAGCTGFGFSWQSLDPDAESPEVTLRLGPERILRGHLVDVQGQPAAKVKLRVVAVEYVDQKDRAARLDVLKRELQGMPDKSHKYVPPKNAWVQLDNAAAAIPHLSAGIVTDANGQFAVRGLAPDCPVALDVSSDSHAMQTLTLPDSSKPEEAESVTRVLEPARVVQGRVTYADTGKPAANVEVQSWGKSHVRTDANGRFRLMAMCGPVDSGEECGILIAYSPEGEPYCNAERVFKWSKGAVKHSIDIALLRGVLVRGKVTDEKTGQPIPGAHVQYFIQQDKLPAEEAVPNNFVNGRDMTETGPDGTFRIACRAAPGYLLIQGPDADYVLRENGGYNRLYLGKHGGQPWHSHGFVALDATPGAEPFDVTVTLRKGITIQGEVAGPEGKPVEDLHVFCRLEGFSTHPTKVRGQRFELHGCDPAKPVTTFFLDAANEWGATAQLSPKDRDKPVRVQLNPLGSARVRFVNKEGKPRVNFYPGLNLVAAPKQGDLLAQTLLIASPFRKVGPHSDDEGYCTLTDLIPGATYQFGYADIETTFTAESGKVVKVPDVIVQNPE
jgi:hypothetical protein